MKSRLFGQRQRKPEPIPRAVPAGTRVYAIGDIHGSLVPLRLLRDAIREHADAHPIGRKCLIYLGDYIDRGFDSRAVIEMLVNEKLPGFEHVFLKGNHEDGLLRFLADGSNATFWVAYGGIATMFSYGVKPPDPATSDDEVIRARKELAKNLPPDHLDFLAKLESYRIEGDYLFVHAGIRPGVPIEMQREEDLLWIRDEFLRSQQEFGKCVVHGHSISRHPDFQPNRIGIDTGAFASGTLTCLVLEGTKQELLAT
ncbi:MAG TPA: metallophosphoesterase family protein [Stellaceae bacterium]|jgi:serine/threonine protein phosphatase 1|nr:metallophosphoesterase family protein [Stellaceae bacterium]